VSRVTGDGQGNRAFAGTGDPASLTLRSNRKKSSIEERSRSLPAPLDFPRPAATLLL
jgi:hypothetical protein